MLMSLDTLGRKYYAWRVAYILFSSFQNFKTIDVKAQTIQMSEADEEGSEEEDKECNDKEEASTLTKEESRRLAKDQNLQINCHFQMAYNQIHSKKQQTPLHALLWQYIYGTTRSKVIPTTLNMHIIGLLWNQKIKEYAVPAY